MKPTLLLLAATAGLCTQCAHTPAVAPTPTLDEKSSALLRELTPQLVGNWTMTEVHVQYKPGFSYPGTPRFPRDTVMRQFATLSLAPASFASPLYPRVEGQLTYQGHTYQVAFTPQATSSYLFDNQGPPLSLLLNYIGPAGTHPTTPNEEFLQFVGLFGGSFSLELADGQQTMVWRGLGHDIERIELRR